MMAARYTDINCGKFFKENVTYRCGLFMLHTVRSILMTGNISNSCYDSINFWKASNETLVFSYYQKFSSFFNLCVLLYSAAQFVTADSARPVSVAESSFKTALFLPWCR